MSALDDEETVRDDEETAQDDEEQEKEANAEKAQEWLEQLEHLGVMTVPTVPATKHEDDAQSDSSDSQGKASSTSHEKGIDLVTEESESDEEEVHQERFHQTFVAEVKKAYKGVRSKLGHVANEMNKAFREEEAEKVRRKKESIPREPQVQETRKRKRNWTVVEIFSWTRAISIMASLHSWTASEPICLPHWDILKSQDREDALNYLDQLDPDLMVIAWPCTVWSPLQAFGSWQREKLEERREEQREALGFVRDASHDQRRRGGLLMGENPKPSLAWKEPLIVEAFDGMGSVTTDMCQYGLRLPQRGPYLRKRRRLMGAPELVLPLAKTCAGRHEHTPVLGGMQYQRKWMNASDFAGGYTTDFAEKVVKTAEEALKNKGRQPETLVAGPSYPEEELGRDEDDEEEKSRGSREEKPQSWRIEQLHNRLGHPTNKTLARMLSLSGALKEVVQRASTYECPTCQETQPPGRYMKANPEVRTTILAKSSIVISNTFTIARTSSMLLCP